MTAADDESANRRRRRWPMRLALAGVAFVLTYPLTWPWVFVVLFKLDELFGRGFGNHPAVESVFTAYSLPLFWFVTASPHLERIYESYLRFVFDLFGVHGAHFG